ncbi:uncharacterized protein LOC129799329 [Phlebotomus papatasi]|uniref:uncharacterized protein LOC129799329 n=1 Tax=Phlebotomus papatasi TaxID=29031 RepID=UPI002483337A|nr:uncharacterized protein LOC129799329 [Phlebotomus papatasi]
MKALSTREQEFIINEVRENPCIWDLNCPEYRNVVAKDRVYGKIAKKLQKPPKKIIKAWSALKEKYKKEKEKEKALKPRSGAAGGRKYIIKSWDLFENMTFLDKILIKKSTEESVSVVFPESKAGISSQIKSDILELDSHSSSDNIILLDSPRAVENSCDPICYQTVEEIPYQVSNRAREYLSQNPGQSFGSSNCTLPNQVSTQISNKVSSQAHKPSTQTKGSSFETPITMFPVHVSVSASNRVPIKLLNL